jgi:hypothetical protein
MEKTFTKLNKNTDMRNKYKSSKQRKLLNKSETTLRKKQKKSRPIQNRKPSRTVEEKRNKKSYTKLCGKRENRETSLERKNPSKKRSMEKIMEKQI